MQPPQPCPPFATQSLVVTVNALPPACSIEGALSYIVNHLAEISQLAAQTDRLDALLTTLVAQQEGVPGGVLRWGGAAAPRLPAGPCLLCLHACVVRRVLCTSPSAHAPSLPACVCAGRRRRGPTLPLLTCCRKPSSDGSVVLEKLTLSTPHGELMVCKDLSLSLAPGQSLLIVGPSGVGKTSIMRAVAGEGAVGRDCFPLGDACP